MKFSRFVWSLYRDSERGRAALAKYSPVAIEFVPADLRALEFTLNDEGRERFGRSDLSVDIADLVRAHIAGHPVDTMDAACARWEALYASGMPYQAIDAAGQPAVVGYFGDDEENWYDYLAALSLGLHLAYPDFFLPYGFRRRFHELEHIHREFGIPLPSIPGKLQKEERSQFYLKVNAVWQEFRAIHGLTPGEMCAFLYDFASEFLTPTSAFDLPAPMKAWMVTGGRWDIEFADTAGTEAVSPWGANAAVRRGDVIVMYLVRPLSCIHSIWRACSDGFVDPVSHYHSIAWIGAPLRTVPISLAELRGHPLLSKKSAVRANFQGPHGKMPLTAEEYSALLSVMEQKGQDLSGLPRIPPSTYLNDVALLTERDVELHLVEPLLDRLGYVSGDWVRQMSVKMGRGQRNYPDYAIGAVPRRGEESARMILEAKFQLTSQREFVDAFLQAKSYALRLQARVLALAAREGIWVFSPKTDTFDLKSHVFYRWAELTHPDALHAISLLIGRDRILGSVRAG